MKEWVSKGISGLFLPAPIQCPRDERNLTTLKHIIPSNFQLFAPTTMVPNVLCHYNDLEDMDRIKEELRGYSSNPDLATTIVIFCDDSRPSWEVSSRIASLLDEVSCDFIWVRQQDGDADDTLQLCEELSYLDVPGPTVKSRLVVDSIEEVMEDCLLMGVTKFVLPDAEGSLTAMRDLVDSQGKIVTSL